MKMLKVKEIIMFNARCLLILTLLLTTVYFYGCSETTNPIVEEPAAAFVSAFPASYSEIATKTVITLTFSSDPGEVTVAGATVTGTGKTRQVAGPFRWGALTLTVSWANGDGWTTLLYTVSGSGVHVIDLDSPPIYWTDVGTDKIQRANLDGPNVEDLVTQGLEGPIGLALDVAGGKMYWTDWGTDKIQCANLDGSDVKDLVTEGLRNPGSLALDVAGGKMYWTDNGTDKIQRANLDGSNVKDLITTGLDRPLSLALDVAGGKMYWTDWGTEKIQCANLDGSNVKDLVTQGLEGPIGLALDVAGGKMYWTDTDTEKIQRANLDGSNVKDLIITGLDFPNILALDVAGGKMYWTHTDWNSATQEHTNGKIQRANLDGSNVEDVITGLDIPGSITLVVE